MKYKIRVAILTSFIFCTLHSNTYAPYVFNKSQSIPLYFTPYDLTIIGTIKFANSLSRISIGLMDMLKDDLTINYVQTGAINFQYVPLNIQNIAQNPDKMPGKVSILVDGLEPRPRHSSEQHMPNSHIKIAYSMLEGSAIPQRWTTILNTHFDAVAVPDNYYQKVYYNCGVRIPIFVLPHLMYLDDYLKQPLKTTKGKLFTFGMSAKMYQRKNHLLLLEAFAKEFGNNKNVRLKMHTNCAKHTHYLAYKNTIKDKIKELRLKNVEFIEKSLSPEKYVKFLTSLDCYVYFSKGEGFSLTPREAMACGIPCILSNNTAQKTICKTGLVLSVPSNIAQPAYYEPFREYIGYNFDCTIQDARKALRQMYTNYDLYLQRTPQAREWVKQYEYKNLRAKYLALLKPKQVFFGTVNRVDDYSLVTNSKSLYEKYLALIQPSELSKEQSSSSFVTTAPKAKALSS
jgi:glycosyltransferase involved in cell wall biosynthesis